MMVIVRNLSKIFLLFIFIGCSGQKNIDRKLTLSKIMDSYIDYASSIDTDFAPKNKYIVLGISNISEEQYGKKLYIMNFCFSCPSPVKKSNNFMVQYRGYGVVIVYDNILNKEYILNQLKNIKEIERFNTIPIPENTTFNYKYWTIEYDEEYNIIFFCAGLNDTKKIKEKLNIDNKVEDCGL